jgi:hypothetical protein
MYMRRVMLGVLACVIAIMVGAVSAQAAVSTASPGGARTNAHPDKVKCKGYTIIEDGAYEGGLDLCKKTGTWYMTGIFESEAGYYITSGPEIELIETSRAGEEECYFLGSKGKKKVAYAGTWECFFPEDEYYSINGTWEALKQ